MKNRKCIKCDEDINPLRLKALPGTKTCVECSTVGAKRGVSMIYGEKDHTWNDMVILEADDADKVEGIKIDKSFKSSKSEMLGFEDDGSVDIWE